MINGRDRSASLSARGFEKSIFSFFSFETSSTNAFGSTGDLTRSLFFIFLVSRLLRYHFLIPRPPLRFFLMSTAKRSNGLETMSREPKCGRCNGGETRQASNMRHFDASKHTTRNSVHLKRNFGEYLFAGVVPGKGVLVRKIKGKRGREKRCGLPAGALSYLGLVTRRMPHFQRDSAKHLELLFLHDMACFLKRRLVFQCK